MGDVVVSLQKFREAAGKPKVRGASGAEEAPAGAEVTDLQEVKDAIRAEELAARDEKLARAYPPAKIQPQKPDFRFADPELSQIDDVVARSLHQHIRVGGVTREESLVKCFWRQIGSLDEITIRKVPYAATARYELVCNQEIIASGLTFTPVIAALREALQTYTERSVHYYNLLNQQHLKVVG